MKHEHIEQPEELLRWKENTEFLLNDVLPWMEQNPGRVNLNIENSSCGAFACIGGWYCMRRYGKEWTSTIYDIKNEFGMSSEYVWTVFGAACEGTLAQRKTRIKNHLSHLNTQIAQWYTDRQVAVL